MLPQTLVGLLTRACPAPPFAILKSRADFRPRHSKQAIVDSYRGRMRTKMTVNANADENADQNVDENANGDKK